MGHRKYSAPRRGSLAYLPRGRSSHWAPRIRFWPDYEGPPRLLGFAGFKAGTTHVTVVDNRQGSLNYGKEVTFPVTVVETPPLRVTALRFYETMNGGLQSHGGLQRRRRSRCNLNHQGKGNPRPREEMGNKETQTQVKKNSQGSWIDWSMAPPLRNVLSAKSRADGVRPENRAQ